MNISLSAFAPENLVSRDGFGSPVLRRQPSHLHTQAESGAYLRDSSRVPRWRQIIYSKPPYAIGSVRSLSGQAIVYRWRSLPRVRRHRVASKPQRSSERVVVVVFFILTDWASTMLLLLLFSVFFTLTDRASTIPSNIRGCQSGTWSAGQKKIRGTSTKLQ